MADNKNPGAVPPLRSAEDLRKALLETEMKKADEAPQKNSSLTTLGIRRK